jgi:hypothetical protein
VKAYRRHLLELLSRSGWEVVSMETESAWWTDGHWCVQSTRENWGLTLWINFLVDPQYEGAPKASAVWAVSATVTRPRNRLEAGAGIVLADLQRGWQRDKMSELVEAITQYRRRGRVEEDKPCPT